MAGRFKLTCHTAFSDRIRACATLVKQLHSCLLEKGAETELWSRNASPGGAGLRIECSDNGSQART